MMTRRLTLLLPALALLAAFGCAKNNTRRYPMEGDIKALDAAAKTATIAAGKIDDWMEPMTMDYAVKPDSEFAKLHVGDHIQATVVVNDPSFYVTDVKVVPPK